MEERNSDPIVTPPSPPEACKQCEYNQTCWGDPQKPDYCPIYQEQLPEILDTVIQNISKYPGDIPPANLRNIVCLLGHPYADCPFPDVPCSECPDLKAMPRQSGGEA